MFWSARPFVRIFILFAFGVFVAFKWDALRGISPVLFYAVLGSLLLFAYFLLPKRFKYKYHWIKGLFLGFAVMVSGVLITTLYYPEGNNSVTQLRGTFVGVISGQPEETDRSYKALVELYGEQDSIFRPLSGKVLIYFEKDTTVVLQYGDIVLFSAVLKEPENTGNPEEFDYKSFLKTKGVELVGFVAADHYRVEGNNPPNRLAGFAIGLRQKILHALKEYGLSGDQYAVAAAIVLGYDDVMEDRIRQNYQRAGAMHVLCVSGLHVGVIYLVMAMLLKFLNKNRLQKVLRVIVLLLAVWFYALLTGMAPSVMRAAVMISFLIIGDEVERDKDAYNTLALSALFLLVINPGFLFNVGFQLSYAAVLGIVTFYRPIYRLLYIKSRVFDKLWAATSVSIAAQTGAFPLAAHYFHFFPTWFLLSNVVILLFSTLIISLGMLFIVVSWIPLVAGWVAYLLSGLIYLMNFLITEIGRLPASGISDLYISWPMVAVIFAVLFTFYRFVVLKEEAFVIPLLSSILLLVLMLDVHRFRNLTQSRIVIYNVNKHSAIDFVNSNKHILLCDSLLLKEQKLLDYCAENCRVKWGLEKRAYPFTGAGQYPGVGLWHDERVFWFNGISIAKIENDSFYPTQEPLSVDWLWVTGKGNVDMNRLNKVFLFNRIIINPTVYDNIKSRVKKKLPLSGILVNDIRDEGALVYSFSSE